MTPIFIKLRFDRADGVGEPCVCQRSGGRRGEAVLWTDVQRLAFRDATTETTNRPNLCISTLSLCNANFGPRLA